MVIGTSTVTEVLEDGDAELARLLASAASFGWTEHEHVSEIARRCAWPPTLTNVVAALGRNEIAALTNGSRLIWDIFAAPTSSTASLDRLLGAPYLTVVEVNGLPRLSVVGSDRPSEQILRSAALGLVQVLQSRGMEALDICAAAGCDQPVLRIGRKTRSRACSPRCANRERVGRHRASRTSGTDLTER